MQGEIPHVDFTSPRPVGSALLHIPELLLQTHLLALSRLIVILQILWISIALFEIFKIDSSQINKQEKFGLIAISFVLNINSWPIMAWPTIDGLFICSTLLYFFFCKEKIFKSENLKYISIWLLAGYSITIKQGFWIIPLLLVFLICVRKEWKLLKFIPIVFVPVLAYLIWVRGFWGGLFEQIHLGNQSDLPSRAWGLLQYFLSPKFAFSLIALCFLVAIPKFFAKRTKKIPIYVLIGSYWITILYVQPPQMSSEAWLYSTIMTLIISNLISFKSNRVETYLPTLALLSLSIAISVSWGVPYPSLLGGTLLSVSSILIKGKLEIMETVSEVSEKRNLPKIRKYLTSPILIESVIFLAILAIAINSRINNTYQETRFSTLNYGVSINNFEWIKMSRETALYISDLSDCVQKYPASKVVLFPDNSGLYPLLRLKNPLDRDWFLAEEETWDSKERFAQDIKELDTGDFLVLIQTFPASSIQFMKEYHIANSNFSGFSYVPYHLEYLKAIKVNTSICKSFLVKYNRGIHLR
jgi:hypothetical protein